MQEKIFRVIKMVINLTKGKGITDDPEEHTSRKGGIDPSILPHSDDLYEQEILRKNPSGWSKHVDMLQRCGLLDNKLKEIEGVDDLESVDPRELSLVLDLVIPPKLKMTKFEKYDGTKCPENHLTTYCNKMAGHAHDEGLLIHVFYNSLARVTTQWYRGLKKNQIRTQRDLARAILE